MVDMEEFRREVRLNAEREKMRADLVAGGNGYCNRCLLQTILPSTRGNVCDVCKLEQAEERRKRPRRR